MTTTTGIVVFIAVIIVGCLGIVLWALAVAAKRGERLGESELLNEHQARALARAQEAQDAEREIETMQRNDSDSAVERLRKSPQYRPE